MRNLIMCISLTTCLWFQQSFAATMQMSLLTYNIAGLPDFISKSKPNKYTKLISPLLNAYDVVLVQEDFIYHRDLVSRVNHPFQSTPDCDLYAKDVHPNKTKWHCVIGLGDGLNRLSRSRFMHFKRSTWQDCNGHFSAGSDCLTTKGFSFAIHEIAPKKFIHIYNHHADAGSDRDDIKTRKRNFEQMAQAIATHSKNAAVIVAGDTNSLYRRDGEALEKFLADTKLVDVWQHLNHYSDESIDKIFFRSSNDVVITPVSYRVEGEKFISSHGDALSDHLAIATEFVVRY